MAMFKRSNTQAEGNATTTSGIEADSAQLTKSRQGATIEHSTRSTPLSAALSLIEACLALYGIDKEMPVRTPFALA